MSQDPTVQFVTSPYAGIFVQVLLKGKSITRIHKGVVPANVLSSRSTQEPAPKSATPILDMQDLGSDTAHVVIHFFYTKQYGCIKPTGISSDSAKGYELKVSLQVIEAATKMKLPALSQKTLKKLQSDDKGKGRDDSEPAEKASEISPPTTSNQDTRLAKGQEEAGSGPSRLRDTPSPFSNPFSGVGTVPSVIKKSDAPQRGGSLPKPVAETTSAVDWELPKLVAEKFEKLESERQDSTPVDSDSEGVLVELEPQPTMTPSPTASDNSAMRRFLAFDRM
ncbi:hypothetical protein FOC1_g10003387 [Fusarium oxysporum f. sp. cubense race 1]|uniref:Uncharacterized protein n=1 Tax=Fusarium oxysporum f. sp. cubense (strain race 1) TaxID=1229664 RepID=N4U6Z9_FUSC1|nr:hypothetical protein FOC1_g10003387 [Fusarium oxysporum f. sp. cubense race 1]